MDTEQTLSGIEKDIKAVAAIDAIPTMLDTICRVAGVGFAAVARVTEDRWVACQVHDDIDFGLLPGGELEIQTTICDEIRQSGQMVVIDDAETDDVYRTHPTPKMYKFRSYISVPIFQRNGTFFGTLCAIDPNPAKLSSPEIINIFKHFADLIGFYLDAGQKLSVSEDALLDARQTAELREHFIAILGHDLRNPVAAIIGGVRLLQRRLQDEESLTLLSYLDESATRMNALIGDMLDFARGRLGGGMPVNLAISDRLETDLREIVNEFRTAAPENVVETTFDINQPVVCDRARIAQLLSNLLGNAFEHGASKMVKLIARTKDNVFELSVTNEGDPIAEEIRPTLFQPFSRVKKGSQGVGLGLYIAAEIAKAHSGELTVDCEEHETWFIFRMPLAATDAFDQ